MLREPKYYEESGHFFFQAHQELEEVCNAPKDKDGVFKVLELRNGRVSLAYIGYSNSGGLFNEIVNGNHYNKNARKVGWTYQLIKDRTDAIDVYWYVINEQGQQKIEQVDMLKNFLDNTGKLPKWNK